MGSAPVDIAVYEVHRPSSRTLKMMQTMSRQGIAAAAVGRQSDEGFFDSNQIRRIPTNTGQPGPATTRARRMLRDPDPVRPAVARAALDSGIPPFSVHSHDPATLANDWLTAAVSLARADAHLYWAADLNALPPVVWAAHAVPGSGVVFDSHELFTELDYLHPSLKSDWETISRILLPRVDLAITVGDAIGRVLTERFGAPTPLTIPNFAAHPQEPCAATLKKTLSLDERTPLCVHVGNITASRNPGLAVDLLCQLSDLHFAFVGEVREDQEVRTRNYALEMGVDDRLHFVAPVSQRELVGYISDANVSAILYSPWRCEHLRLTMPNKLYDSLAAGIPVVAAHPSEPAMFLRQSGLGRSFTDGDVDSLAQAVSDCLTDDSITDRVRRRMHDFIWSQVEEQLAIAFRESLASARSSRAKYNRALPNETTRGLPGASDDASHRKLGAILSRISRRIAHADRVIDSD